MRRLSKDLVDAGSSCYDEEEIKNQWNHSTKIIEEQLKEQLTNLLKNISNNNLGRRLGI